MGGLPVLDVNLADCDVQGGTVSFGPDGNEYGLNFGPVDEELLVSLSEAARANARIRLAFKDKPIIVDLLTIERMPPGRVRLCGRVVQPTAVVGGRRTP